MNYACNNGEFLTISDDIDRVVAFFYAMQFAFNYNSPKYWYLDFKQRNSLDCLVGNGRKAKDLIEKYNKDLVDE